MSKTKKNETANKDFEILYRERFLTDVAKMFNALCVSARDYKADPEIIEDIKTLGSDILVFAAWIKVMSAYETLVNVETFANKIDKIVES